MPPRFLCRRSHVAKLDNRSGFIDLFWPGVLLVEQKSAGRDLKAAYKQAGEYFDALPERERPRYILVSDFQTFELHDLDEREVAAFALTDLPAHVEAFGFILGVQRRLRIGWPRGRIVETELRSKLNDPGIALDWSELRASDIASRARAFQSMVGGGMPLDRAAALSGLMVPDDAALVLSDRLSTERRDMTCSCVAFDVLAKCDKGALERSPKKPSVRSVCCRK